MKISKLAILVNGLKEVIPVKAWELWLEQTVSNTKASLLIIGSKVKENLVLHRKILRDEKITLATFKLATFMAMAP